MQVSVITTVANGKEALPVPIGIPEKVDGVVVRYYRRWTGDHTHLSPALMAQLWRTVRQYDVVHIHSWWNLVAIPGALICWLKGVRPFFSPRGMLSPYGREQSKFVAKALFHRLLGRRLLMQTILHATSIQEAQEALLLLPDWPFFVAPNLIDLPAGVSASYPVPEPSLLRLVFLSRLHPKKGLDLSQPWRPWISTGTWN